jgi:hypothetical protein
MNPLYELLGFPQLPDIDTQLGAAINDEPAPELAALYLQLLVGFHLISERNTYPGYAMVRNEGVAEPEQKLLQEHQSAVMSIAKKAHGYWRTAVLAANQRARKRHCIPVSHLEWIEQVDPTLFSAMKNIGLPFCNRDCGSLMVHFMMEQEAHRPMINAQAK